MKNLGILSLSATVLSTGLLSACATESPDGEDSEAIATAEQAMHGNKNKNDGSYNLHLEKRVRFTPVQPGSDIAAGRALFGLDATDPNLEDNSGALFEGFSVAAQDTIVSNGRSCFTCHRGIETNFGLAGELPLSSWIDLSDALFTGIAADAGDDPDAFDNLDNHALFKYRPNRFNLHKDPSDPFRRVFFWRKSPTLMNISFNQSFLNDGRGRNMLETDRGAVFSHTQGTDARFDDLFTIQNAADLEAFEFSELFTTDAVLLALRDPDHPMHDTLIDDPFYTVPVSTHAQKKGKKLFKKYCMDCHNTPNVFGGLDNVETLGAHNTTRGTDFPAFAPSTGRTYNIGVSEANMNNLRFTDHQNGFETIALPLAAEDGTIVNFPVTFDIGLASTTARLEDVGRFKVPQLRDLVNNAPYFHDNSVSTIEGIVDYFDSPAYNNSRDGKKFKIHLNHNQKEDLVEFLKIL